MSGVLQVKTNSNFSITPLPISASPNLLKVRYPVQWTIAKVVEGRIFLYNACDEISEALGYHLYKLRASVAVTVSRGGFFRSPQLADSENAPDSC